MDPIERVQDGMHVVDVTGGRVGTVAEVRFGDREPEAEAGLPRPGAELLLRIGYVRVDTGGLFGDDTYFTGDEIIAVERDTVHITQRITVERARL
jgi:hypothetical protein